jgi:inosine-uridine nucleoside N-ribohydrolase
LVIADIEQDRDDLLAVSILVHMHHLGIIRHVGFIANHGPSKKRSKFLRIILHLLGFSDVPVAAVTDGTGGKNKRDLNYKTKHSSTRTGIKKI